MKRESLLVIGLFFVLVSFSLVYVSGASVNFPSATDKYVDDFAGVFDAGQVFALRSLLNNVELNTTAEVVVVTISDLQGYSIFDYSMAIADAWKIGKADKDNGLLILYAKDINKIQVLTGYGLEGILNDAKIGRLLDENYVQLRDAGNVSQGIIAFTLAVSQVLFDNREEILSGQAGANNQRDNEWIFVLIVFLIFFIIPGILRRIFRKKIEARKKNKDYKPVGLWDILFWMWIGSSLGRRSGGGFSSGGFSGGGGGFGGGGFGGGGASR